MNASVAEKRPVGALGRMGMVAGLHVAALYLIASSLGIVPPLVQEPVTTTTLIDEQVTPVDPVPAVTQPDTYQPVVFVPTPEVPPAESSDSENTIVAERNDDPPVIPEVVPPAHTAQLMGVRMDARYPLTQPSYPQSDIRQGNEGTAEIEVYVLPTGRIGDARILKSAGSPTLDQSALDEAKRRWRMLPATRDGEPYAQWHRLKVTFNLKNR
jgi:periplasmic protein TonB